MNNTAGPQVIAVLGCTGTVGAEVMRQVATRDCTIRGILRQAPQSYPVPPRDRPACVSFALVDHSSEDQLSQAFVGVDAMFLLIGTHPAQVQTESRMIAAAQRAGVRRIIKLSAPLVTAPASVEAANWHRAVEAQLAASGLEFCCLRPYAFMQNWLRNTYTIKRFGTIIGSAGAAPRNYVDCRDVAAIATRLLLSDQMPHTDAITITGPEVISNQEMTERISCVTGATVRCINLSRSEHYRMLITQAQLPEWLAQHIVELEELAIRIPEQATNSVAALLDRAPRTMNAFLHEHRSAFMQKNNPIPI
ncbi:MAG: NAD(P)H-binding protein [Chloroflexales bacterium]|nr:NAD(P)H-binding protein [Chloroflexales bacterium]